MSRAVLETIQMQRFASARESVGMARDNRDQLTERRSEAIDRSYELRAKAVDKAREAREEAGLFSLIGTILLPVIGTFLGELLGGSTVSDELDEKATFDRQAGLADLGRARLERDAGDLKEVSASAKSDAQAAQRLLGELARTRETK